MLECCEPNNTVEKSLILECLVEKDCLEEVGRIMLQGIVLACNILVEPHEIILQVLGEVGPIFFAVLET